MPWRVQYLITSGASICHSSPRSPANLQITDAGDHHTINPLCGVCAYNVLFYVTLTTVKCRRLLVMNHGFFNMAQKESANPCTGRAPVH